MDSLLLGIDLEAYTQFLAIILWIFINSSWAEAVFNAFVERIVFLSMLVIALYS